MRLQDERESDEKEPDDVPTAPPNEPQPAPVQDPPAEPKQSPYVVTGLAGPAGGITKVDR